MDMLLGLVYIGLQMKKQDGSPKHSAHEVGYISLVSPKGHRVYTLTNIKKEAYIHSPMAVT